MSLPDFTALNERRAAAGLVDVHEPAQLRRRARSASSTRSSPPSARCRCGATAIGATEGLALRPPLGGAGVAARARLPGQRRRQAAADRGRGRRPVPGLAGAPRRAGLRDRRRRGQGRRLRAAAPPRRRRARPALGDRLEVPADDGGDDAQRDQWNVGKFGDLHPFARARAGPRRRRDRQAGDAAQRGGPRAQGHPRRRRGDRPARRRRDPAGASRPRRTRVERRDRAPPPQPPERCPFCDTPTVKAEGAVFTKCPNRDCPERRWQLLKHFVSRGAMDIDGLGEKQVAHVPGGGARAARAADFYRLTARAAAASSRASARCRRQAASTRSRRPRSGRSGACCSRSGSRASATSPAATWRQRFRTIDALLAATPEQIAETPGIGPMVAELIARAARRRADARADRRPARRRLRFEEEGAAARRGPAGRARRSC